MAHVLRKFVWTFIIYVIYAVAVIPWFVDPFIVLKNNHKCMDNIPYSMPDSVIVHSMYSTVIFEWPMYGIPLLFLFVEIVICGYPIYGLIITCIAFYSCLTIIVSIICITDFDYNLNTIMYIPIKCYGYVPNHVYGATFTYRTLYALSIVTIIFCIFTICVSARLFHACVKKNTFVGIPVRYPLLEETFDEKIYEIELSDIHNEQTTVDTKSSEEKNEVDNGVGINL